MTRSRTTWTAFFKPPAGASGLFGNFPNESVCQSYVGALRPDVPAACRQLARPVSCPVACVAPVQPPAPTGSIPPKPPEVTPPPEPDPKPDPASIETKPSDIQVGGKQYTKVAGLTWVERESQSRIYLLMFRWGRTTFRAKISPLPCRRRRAEAPKAPKRVVQGPHYYDRAPQPLQAFIDTVMLPFDFLSYPGRRDW